ncbi:MAG: hypothetical protein MHPSP_001784, partial [Paramarteilia canceri]
MTQISESGSDWSPDLDALLLVGLKNLISWPCLSEKNSSNLDKPNIDQAAPNSG